MTVSHLPDSHSQCAHSVPPPLHFSQMSGSAPLQSDAFSHSGFVAGQMTVSHLPETHSKCAQAEVPSLQRSQMSGRAP